MDRKLKYYDFCMKKIQELAAYAKDFCKNQTQETKRIGEVSFAVGSDMHRGYYSPSPIFDLVIGNVHRGRLLLKPNSRSRISHSYSFDQDGHLLFVQRGSLIEHLVWNENRRFGYTFEGDALQEISGERFLQDKIVEYVYVVLSTSIKEDTDLRGYAWVETYDYEDNELTFCDQYYVPFRSPHFLMYNKYRFCYREGKICAFWLAQEDGSLKFEKSLPCKLRDPSSIFVR